MSDSSVVQFQASKEMLSLLVEAVEEKLQRWPGGDPIEQERLIAMKRVLFVATLELTLDIEMGED
tara:strand:- start:1 stop:195 length:195 start_codon:yes stop_codon:yes gene_type:complete